MELSIVTTLYRSEAYVDPFYARATRAAAQVTTDYEIVFVNDGSPDASLDRVLQIIARDPRVRVLDLSRNFGHHFALSAGLDAARGQRVFMIDSDLEEDPEWIEQFWKEMDQSGADVVYGVQTARSGSFLSVFPARLFYKLFNFMSEVRIAADACTVRLMSRRYVEALLSLRDKALFLAGTSAWTGFDQRPVPVNKQQRRGLSSYGLLRKVELFVRAATSFTAYPLKLIFLLGILISLLGMVLGTWLVLKKLVDPDSVLMGYASTMASLWFVGGVIITFLGVIGIYLSTVFTELKDRPPYVVRAFHGGERPVAGAGPLPRGGEDRT
ncbi:MAG: glycosyltransferase family 2 protein [Planctomycetota bacterium]